MLCPLSTKPSRLYLCADLFILYSANYVLNHELQRPQTFTKISWTKMQKAKKRNDDPRKRRELLEGRFAVTKAVYVEREDDGDAILSKAFDFSRITLDDLLQKGYDAGEDTYDKAAKN